MPCTCEAYNCGKKRERGQTGISFHQFPKDKDLYKEWLRAIKKDENWKPGSESKVCSRHFTADSYEQGKRKKLKSDAVPTIFSSPEESEKKGKAKRPTEKNDVPNEENEAREEADEDEVPDEEEAAPEAPAKKKGATKAKNADAATKEPAKKKRKTK